MKATLRQRVPPACIDNVFVFMHLFGRWTPSNVCKHVDMQDDIWKAITGACVLQVADVLRTAFASLPHVSVLELGCGSGLASELLCEKITATTKVQTWIATDILPLWKSVKHFARTCITFAQSHYVQAVHDFGRNANVLLLIAPLAHELPAFRRGFASGTLLVNDNAEFYCGYADYYAIKMFIEQQTESTTPRLLVFVGELGVAHGSQGLYYYLFNHPRLQIEERCALADPSATIVNHEVFVFKIK